MDHLRRELAPVTSEAWRLIEEEATRSLTRFLAGRALVDFSGPAGWDFNTGALAEVRATTAAVTEGVQSAVRVCRPVVETRTEFSLSLAELDLVDRGRPDPDLDPVVEAARRAARAEDTAVFHGYPAAGLDGIVSSSPYDPLPVPDDYDEYPGSVARAVATLQGAGIGGPYALVLGARCYTGVIETTEHGGYPLLEHMKLILGGPVLRAPVLDGATVVSLRSGDYEFQSGQDFSIGYAGHDGDDVHLYLEESFSVVIHEPKAAIALAYPPP